MKWFNIEIIVNYSQEILEVEEVVWVNIANNEYNIEVELNPGMMTPVSDLLYSFVKWNNLLVY